MSFAKLSQKNSPNPFLLDLIKSQKIVSGTAIDIGAGQLIDSEFLVQSGFSVISIDVDETSKNIYNEKTDVLRGGCIFVYDSVVNYKFELDSFDLVVSFLTLPFLSRHDFDMTIKNISKSIKTGGYICVSFFGVDDDWAKQSRDGMTFVSESEVRGLFTDCELIRLVRDEKIAKTVSGTSKFWQIYTVVFRKK